MSLSVKAGRASRVPGTNHVEASTTKGTLALGLGEEGLLHLTWKNRETTAVEDVRFDIHIVPRSVLIAHDTPRI
jgi:Proteasome complex subunit Rpn13 ubiquitin receptor